ncbi:hypothetical protein [Paenibacillus sp. WLX2291]|uniref:hypothetical protein n=1 Tax=Paenibacillus sp. WLX2291 TaxID=3296934 RepID=UPI0039842BFF
MEMKRRIQQIFKRIQNIKLLQWIFIGIAFSIFMYPVIKHYDLELVKRETDDYLTAKYHEPFTITGLEEEFRMYTLYNITAVSDRYPTEEFSVRRNASKPEDYIDNYLSIKPTQQSEEIIEPILKKSVHPPGWAFIDFDRDRPEQGTTGLVDLSYTHVNMVYIIQPNEKMKYIHKVEHLIEMLKQNGVTQASFTVYFYDRTHYSSLQQFKDQLQQAGHPVTLAAQSGKALLSEETFDIGLSDK